MRILITGAVGMVGRKLTDRLLRDGRLAGKAITALDLHDIVPAQALSANGIDIAAHVGDLADDGAAVALVSRKPEIIFHLAGIVSGEAEANFELGYRVNLDGTRRLFDAVREAAYGPRLVFTSSIAVFGAPFPDVIPDEFHPDSADLLRHPEADGRGAAGGLYAARILQRRRHPAADDLRASGQAEQGGLRFLFRHHPRTARGAGSDFCRCRAPWFTHTPARARQ